MANEYISLADYKTLNGVAGVASDTIISDVIEMASRAIDKFCGTVFYPRSVEEGFDGVGVANYYTRHRPIIAVTELARDRDDDGTYEDVVAAVDYRVYNNKISLLKYAPEGLYAGQASVFTRGQQNWRVSYSYGVADIPKPIELATSMLVNYILTDGESTLVVGFGDGYISERIGNYSYRKGEALLEAGIFPPQVRSILSLYRGLRIGGRDGQG